MFSHRGFFLLSALGLVWLDLRTQSTVERLIKKAPGENKNHLKVRDDGHEVIMSYMERSSL